MKITFIGLGIMGSRMATNLIENGIEITVFNRDKKKALPLREKGAIVADTITEAVIDADIVWTMLSTPQVVKELFYGVEGVLQKMKKGAIWVDSSTVNPSFCLDCSLTAKQVGVNYIDAPVAGSKPQAEDAELVFFLGGDKKEIEVLKPYLEIMGKKHVHIGEAGKGASFKMLVNAMLAQSMLMFSETVLLGEKLGLSTSFLLDVLPDLPVSAPITKVKAKAIREGDYEVQFPLEWMYKDLQLVSTTADECNQPLYLANLTKELFAEAKNQGIGRLDFAAIHQFLNKRSI